MGQEDLWHEACEKYHQFTFTYLPNSFKVMQQKMTTPKLGPSDIFTSLPHHNRGGFFVNCT